MADYYREKKIPKESTKKKKKKPRKSEVSNITEHKINTNCAYY